MGVSERYAMVTSLFFVLVFIFSFILMSFVSSNESDIERILTKNSNIFVSNISKNSKNNEME